MGKTVTVKFNGLTLSGQKYRTVYMDLTVGNEYSGYMPDAGESDPHGFTSRVQGEVWLEDDTGDSVVGQLEHGFEIVE